MAKQSGGGKMETAVKLVFMFFISLLSFSVGTFVGKGFSDSEYLEASLEKGEYKDFSHSEESEHQTERGESLTAEDIASLTDEFVENEKREIASHHDDGHHAKPDAHGGHEDASAHYSHGKPAAHDEHAKPNADGYKKVGKTPAHKEEHPAAHPPTPHGEPKHAEHGKPAAHPPTAGHTPEPLHTKPHAAPGHREVAHAASRVADGKAPTADPKPVRKPDSVLPSVATSSVGKYTVQVASYPGEEEARSHAAKLKALGFSAFYVPADLKDKTWYRVSVGLFTTSESAQAFRKDFMRDAKVTTAIVTKIVQ